MARPKTQSVSDDHFRETKKTLSELYLERRQLVESLLAEDDIRRDSMAVMHDKAFVANYHAQAPARIKRRASGITKELRQNAANAAKTERQRIQLRLYTRARRDALETYLLRRRRDWVPDGSKLTVFCPTFDVNDARALLVTATPTKLPTVEDGTSMFDEEESKASPDQSNLRGKKGFTSG